MPSLFTRPHGIRRFNIGDKVRYSDAYLAVVGMANTTMSLDRGVITYVSSPVDGVFHVVVSGLHKENWILSSRENFDNHLDLA